MREIKPFVPYCGDCKHWLKKDACPRERTVEGKRRGPVYNSAICDSFYRKAP